MTKCAVGLCIVMLLVAVPTSAMAQGNTSTVQGTVGDADGAGLPGVLVTARNQDTGITQSNITDRAGRYRVAGIPRGTYIITFVLQGFASLERPDIMVRLDEELILDVALQLSAVEETITVTAETPLIESTKAEFTTSISGE